MPRSLLSSAEWRELLALRERQGLTFRELSEVSGIRSGTLAERARRERKGSRPPRAPFAEIVLREGGQSSGFEVDLRGGRRIRVPRDFDADALARFLAVLESSC